MLSTDIRGPFKNYTLHVMTIIYEKCIVFKKILIYLACSKYMYPFPEEQH